jgi:hypothetical protein
VLSMDRGNGNPKESLESTLRSALRWNDPELDQILCALEEISHGLKATPTEALARQRRRQLLMTQPESNW